MARHARTAEQLTAVEPASMFPVDINRNPVANVYFSGVNYGCTIFDSCFGSGVRGRCARVALQQELGLLPQRRPGRNPRADDRASISQPYLEAYRVRLARA